MNEEKEINELATEIYTLFRSRPMSRALARHLYDKGWRKVDSVTFVGGVVEQLRAEVIEEYRKKVYSKMEKYTVFGREYIQRIMREAEKEMKGGAE